MVELLPKGVISSDLLGPCKLYFELCAKKIIQIRTASTLPLLQGDQMSLSKSRPKWSQTQFLTKKQYLTFTVEKSYKNVGFFCNFFQNGPKQTITQLAKIIPIWSPCSPLNVTCGSACARAFFFFFLRQERPSRRPPNFKVISQFFCCPTTATTTTLLPPCAPLCRGFGRAGPRCHDGLFGRAHCCPAPEFALARAACCDCVCRSKSSPKFIKRLFSPTCESLASRVTTGANPTIASYNASVVKFYNATGSLARFENKNIYFFFEKRSSPTKTLEL
jgi:hypothetical protein